MGRLIRRITLWALCALVVAVGVPATAGAVVLGIADNSPAMFSDPRYLALDARVARAIVPWDIVTRAANRGDLRGFRAWMAGAQHDHVTPLVSFGADLRGAPAHLVPTLSQYRQAVGAFLHAFPRIRTYTAWNEPDFSYRALARDPALAADFFNTLDVLCHHCTVLAGDLYLPTSGPATIAGASARLGPWLRAYLRGLHHRPAGWALHDYTEIRGRNTSQLRTLLAMTSGPVWLDETGGVLRRGHWSYANQSANQAARDEKFLLSVAHRYRRVTHILHYEWQGNADAGWDSGLIAPNGRPRPAYRVLLRAFRKGS